MMIIHSIISLKENAWPANYAKLKPTMQSFKQLNNKESKGADAL